MPTLNIQPRNVITNDNGELRSVVGPQAMEALRYRTLIVGLRFEAKSKMRMTRGPSCLARAKKITGLKTNDVEKHIARLEEMQNASVEKCIVVDANEKQI
jgi:hypothetical protein